jgi:hypothetical protein
VQYFQGKGTKTAWDNSYDMFIILSPCDISMYELSLICMPLWNLRKFIAVYKWSFMSIWDIYTSIYNCMHHLKFGPHSIYIPLLDIHFKPRDTDPGQMVYLFDKSDIHFIYTTVRILKPVLVCTISACIYIFTTFWFIARHFFENIWIWSSFTQWKIIKY